jgi:zinc transport system substrate-binding protein
MAAAMIAVLGMSEGRPLRAAALTTAPGTGPLEAFAGIPPVAYLVERVGGRHVHVEVLLQAGKDPHIFEPTPRQVIALSRASLFFRVGMPFEDRLVEHIVGGRAGFTVVNTAAGIAARAADSEGDDAHGDCDHEEEGQTDPHVWLSPPRLKTMAANVAAALCRADPQHAQAFRANLKILDDELDALDHRIAKSLSPYRGQAFYVFHPAFGYFADTYGLRQESVEVEGKPPTPGQIFSLVTKARNDRVRIIFLQPQFNQQIAASIAQAIDGAVMPLDSLGYDVVANLDDVAEKLAAANRRRAE